MPLTPVRSEKDYSYPIEEDEGGLETKEEDAVEDSARGVKRDQDENTAVMSPVRDEIQMFPAALPRGFPGAWWCGNVSTRW